MSDHLERPIEGPLGNALFGSDIVAETLRALDIPYIALNPGASYRGLHDSIVNHLGNENPSMLLCVHEDHAVGIAHGYGRATGEPMACILHSNVGLMHGMAGSAALLVLAGCTNRLAEREALAGQFVGKTEADLVREAGVPSLGWTAGR